MKNRYNFNNLFDLYQDLLTEIEQETFKCYYEEDLSLTEIAENRNISKSSVGKTLTIAENKLMNYEQILHCLEIKEQLETLLEEEDIDLIKSKIRELLAKE